MEQSKQVDDMRSKSEEMVKNLRSISDKMNLQFSSMEGLIPKVVSNKNGIVLLSNGMIKFENYEQAKKYFDKIK